MEFPLKNGICMTKEEKIEYLQKEFMHACETFGRWRKEILEESKKPRVELWLMLPETGKYDIDWTRLYKQADKHIGPIWGLSPNDVEGKEFDEGATQALVDLDLKDIPEKAFAVKILLTDLEWEDGDPSCCHCAGWGMKAELMGYDFIPDGDDPNRELDETDYALVDKSVETFRDLLEATRVAAEAQEKEGAAIDKIIAEILFSAPIVYGLKAQGHVPTVRKMLEEGSGWEEIAKAIGWDSETLQKHYSWVSE